MILAERAARLAAETKVAEAANAQAELSNTCLLYTSDAADEL